MMDSRGVSQSGVDGGASLEEQQPEEEEEELGAPTARASSSEYEGLTTRAVVVGLALGTLTTVENIYFAIKYGWTVTNNITAAIAGFAIVKALDRLIMGGKRPMTPQENCVLMTVAVSATAMVWGGSMPFALLGMGREIRDANGFIGDTEVWEPTVGKLLVYSCSLCYIGFTLAIPLRKMYVLEEPLCFPYATAAARTITSLHGEDDKPGFLLWCTFPAMCVSMLLWCVAGLERVPLFGVHAQTSYLAQANLSVAPFGHGFIVPAVYILSEVLGAALVSVVVMPLARSKEGEWYSTAATGFQGIQAYYMMPAIVVVSLDSIYSLLKILVLSLLEERRRLSKKRRGQPLLQEEAVVVVVVEKDALAMPRGRWLGLWVFFSGVATVSFVRLFGCRWDMTLLATVSSPLWSVGITQAVGNTGSNVASACGKVMIILFAAWYGEPHVVSTLALGALSIAVIDQALDLVRDFKTAHLLGASPKAMLAAQLLGATVSIVSSSVLYYIYYESVTLPSAALPAVIAKQYRALAVAFAGGIDQLPKNCLLISGACGVLGLSFNVLRDVPGLVPLRYKPHCPNAIAFGVGLYVLLGQSLASLLGLICAHFWRRNDPVSYGKRHEIFGAALLAGDGLGGVWQSALEVAKIKPPITLDWSTFWY